MESRRVLGYLEEMDTDEQVTTEELIAGAIRDKMEAQMEIASREDGPRDGPHEIVQALSEEDCADLGRHILRTVLGVFRPDLCEFDEDEDEVTWEVVAYENLTAYRGMGIQREGARVDYMDGLLTVEEARAYAKRAVKEGYRIVKIQTSDREEGELFGPDADKVR